MPFLSAASTHTYLSWTRFQMLTEWWHWPAIGAACLLLLSGVIWLYRRDTQDLPRTTRTALFLLRCAALVMIFLFFLGLELRSEQRIISNSRLAILVDASQSMGLNDDTEEPPAPRMDRVLQLLDTSDWLAGLRQDHEVSVYRTGLQDHAEPLAVFPKFDLPAEDRTSVADPLAPPSHWLAFSARLLTAVAGLLFLAFLAVWWRYGQTSGSGRLLLTSTLLALAGGSAWAMDELRAEATHPTDLPPADGEFRETRQRIVEDTPSDWSSSLSANLDTTRLGDAVFSVLQQNRGQPLAGLILLTDGANNQGRTPESVTVLARQQTVPVYAVGLGINEQPRNVRLSDFQIPPRVYPEDQFQATAYVQSVRMQGRQIDVQLFASRADEQGAEETLVDTITVNGGSDNEIVTVPFPLEPQGEGTWNYRVSIPLRDDEVDKSDNEMSARVQGVSRSTHILLFAGGPTREYRFLRNQIHRDATMTADVLLQTAAPGAAQEARRLRDDFPRTAEDMYEYDCLVAIDPDWSALDDEQITLCEQWVSEQAGGMILITGPVNTRAWAETPRAENRLARLRALYPVTFYRRTAAPFDLGRHRADSAWPLQFTDEGKNARFLWLGDTFESSQASWSLFDGVYGYYAVKGVKPGATIYADFSDPETQLGGSQPPLIVGQFYGAGRCLFIGTGEFWRLRAVDVAYQEQLYTKTIRYVSEGRLLRDSPRGTLLVDKPRCSRGDRITVRANLKDSQQRNWVASSVEASITSPDGRVQPLTLVATSEAEGVFQANFIAASHGTYRILLPVPESDEQQLLTQEVMVRLSDRELEQPLRNDVLLSNITSKTSGTYYVGMPAMLGQRGLPALARQLRPRTQTTVIEGTPSQTFDRIWMRWLLTMVCGCLCFEWLIRRLHRLA